MQYSYSHNTPQYINCMSVIINCNKEKRMKVWVVFWLNSAMLGYLIRLHWCRPSTRFPSALSPSCNAQAAWRIDIYRTQADIWKGRHWNIINNVPATVTVECPFIIIIIRKLIYAAFLHYAQIKFIPPYMYQSLIFLPFIKFKKNGKQNVFILL